MTRYLYYDHAGWVQNELTASKQRKPTARERERAKERCGWHGAPDKLNDFQKRAINVLGIVGGGIYNCPVSWNTVKWWPRQLIFTWYGNGFGTWDYHNLTTFMLLCHKARIRGYIGPCNQKYLHVFLSEREHEGAIHTRHPNLEEALEQFNSWYPHEHPITYPGDKEQFLTGSRHSSVWPEVETFNYGNANLSPTLTKQTINAKQ